MKVFLLVYLVLVSAFLHACPFCNSNTAVKIRSSLFGPDLVFNLFITFFPFIIFWAIAYFIYRNGMRKT